MNCGRVRAMADERRTLRLPGNLTWSTLCVALALSGASCGDDDAAPPVDASPPPSDVALVDAPARDGGEVDSFVPPSELFCIYDNSVDAAVDAASCNHTVELPDACAEGCRAVG